MAGLLIVCLGRDGYPSDPASIYLSAGASSGVNTLLHIICSSPKTGILVPMPQYPLYTATLSVLDARAVPYYLEESKGWSTDMDTIRDAHKKAVSEGTDVRAIVIINPGNPTGASLPQEDIKKVIGFAAEEKLMVMADEVYQTNVFKGQFHSFKQTLRELQKQSPGKYDNVELASLHSISKGMVGECGHRGGYFELVGFDPEVAAQIYKFISIMLCPPVIGQCLVEMMVNPPKQGDPSYELYIQEYDAIFDGLKQRAHALYKAFLEMEGVECEEPQVRWPRLSYAINANTRLRAPCISSPPFTSHLRRLSKRRRRIVNQTSSTAFVYWMPLGSVSFRGVDSDRRKGRIICEQPSWRRERSGWAGSPSFTRNSWISIDQSRLTEHYVSSMRYGFAGTRSQAAEVATDSNHCEWRWELESASPSNYCKGTLTKHAMLETCSPMCLPIMRLRLDWIYVSPAQTLS